jgi:hypothetical protein
MNDYQFWSLIGLIVGGFGYMMMRMDRLSNKIESLSERVARIEGAIWRNWPGNGTEK